MTKPAATPRARLRAVAAATVCVLGALACAAPAHASDPLTTVLDRTNSEPVDVPATTERAQDRLRQRLGDAALLETDPVTGTPRIVARLDGFLTPPSSNDPETITLDYLRDHAGAFGVDAGDLADLRLTDREQGPDGTVHLSWEQRAGGLPNVDGGLQAAVTAEGRLLNVRGGVVPDLDADSPEPLVSAAAAYATVIPGAAPLPAASTPSGPDRETTFAGGGTAALVRYQDEGAERLGWRLLVPAGPDAFYKAIVDARTGTLQRRANLVRFASVNHFDVNPVAENGELSTSDVSAWLDPGTDRLKGPHVHAVSDVDDSINLAGGGAPYALTQEPDDSDEVREAMPAERWLYDPELGPDLGFCEPLCSWKGTNRTANREFSTAQLFWYVNTFHDHLADPPIGFTSQSDGFEAGADHVLAQSLDGASTNPGGSRPDNAHINNASMITLPDGEGALMEVNLFRFDVNGETKRYDGSHDAGLVYHEYTHALTDRLVTDPQGFGAMDGAQPGALAEGISDFYALDFLAETQPAEVPDTTTPGEVQFGAWLGEVRTQGVDCAVGDLGSACPGTGTAGTGGYDYGDFGRVDTGFPAEVHDNGEIWAQTLWSLRTALTAAHGEQDGLLRTRTYVTNGLRLAPDNPTFLDMRNAIVQAAVNAEDSEGWTSDRDMIWEAFADRGMGYFAGSDGRDDISPTPDFTHPDDLSPSGTITGTVVDDDGDPLEGATVGIAGFDGGLGPQHSDETDPDGTYTISEVPTDETHRYPVVRARKAGFAEDRKLDVLVETSTSLNFQLARDWSSSKSAVPAAVRSFTGPDNTPSGCGPGGLIDDDPGTVWGSSRDDVNGQEIVVELAAPVDVKRVAIDPGAGCGDDDSAALGAYQVYGASTPGGPYRPLGAPDAFVPGDIGTLTDAFNGSELGIRYIKLHAKAPQDTTAGGSGEHFLDVAELHIARVPGSPVGAAANTGGAVGVGTTAATMTGSVVPHGASAAVWFEYGTTTSYDGAVHAGSTPAGESAAPVAAAVGGLQPSTTYHFRVVALRDGRRYEGGDATFTTGAAPPPPPEPQPPTPTVTPTPTPTPPEPRVTVLIDTSLKATRKGLFKVRAFFGDAAPAGNARFTVMAGKRKRLARATTPVVAGRNVMKTLRLTRTGRRMIKPGRSKRITLELRLPSGEKYKKTLKLTRSKH